MFNVCLSVSGSTTDTFSNWKNSIRHKMKCIMDGSSRTLLSEMEGRALQLWDIVAYNRLPRYVRKRPADEADDMHAHDESTHSSSAFYSGGGGGSGGNTSVVGGTHIKEELVIGGHNGHDHAGGGGGEHDMLYNNGSDHDGSAMLLDAAAAAAAAQSTGGDEEEEDEYEDENSTPMPMKITQAVSIASTPMAGSVKRRKCKYERNSNVSFITPNKLTNVKTCLQSGLFLMNGMSEF